ncbi:MAG: family 78 glycoside hydrolase catalytic domain [Clostridia bacterium]|nr:family 78 glycoside hydrolase catalytic domain [Clostridia bacterium]
MKQHEMFGEAMWLCAGEYASDTHNRKPDGNGIPHFPVLRTHFPLCGICGLRKATLRVIGLGYFHCYINGKEVTEDKFLPLSTDYEVRNNRPTEEMVTGHRIYVPEYDVTELLSEGENVLALHFGGGWYTYEVEKYGNPKAIFRLTIETECGTTEVVSNEFSKVGDSFVKTYFYTECEHHDYTKENENILAKDYDDSAWKNAVPAQSLETEYEFTDCPPDRVAKVLPVTTLKKDENGTHYDCGLNMSGYPVLNITAKAGETVEVTFAEEKNADGTPDMRYNFNQKFTVVSDGTPRTVKPLFTWFAFRYFTVKGDAEAICVEHIHTDNKITSAFDSDNETLNWIYRAYLNTQLSNMHGGIPSDCPHIERRGYTGDGQLACHAAMTTLDARKFYEKWIKDIGDCQDIYSGHVQYTAPYTRCGGGPGGWGCAIAEVPYQYYKHYGDMAPMKALYPQMLRYFDYLETHSVNGLVASDKMGEWCLGDWCAPIQVILPAAFVNNYFYIKSMQRVIEIGRLIGRETEIPMLEKRIKERRDAVTAAYFNTWDGNFIGGMQGANAIAIDMGVGDDRTYQNLVKYYKQLGRYDTGIFGTDIVTRVLFEHGDGQLAAELMMSTDPISFDGMRVAGATTIWENWPHATWDRSHNHPMFGAVTAYLFDYLAGIREEAGKAGYNDILIAPVMVNGLNRICAKRTVPKGEVSVSYEKQENTVSFVITVPAGIRAEFRFGEKVTVLEAGTHTFTETV